MSGMTLPDLSRKIAEIDFCMFETRTEGGDIAARPMSNNGDVEYTGDSHFFTWEQSRTVDDIKRTPHVGLSFVGKGGPRGEPPVFIAVQGDAELIRDKDTFQKHWNPDLERWFQQGVDTPGMVLIKVQANRIHYWDGEDDGELEL